MTPTGMVLLLNIFMIVTSFVLRKPIYEIGSSFTSQPCNFTSFCRCSYRNMLLDVSCYGNQIPPFSKTVNITFIELSLPDLESIPSGSFINLIHLREMDLSGNNLRYLGPGTFTGLISLQKLNLRSNNLNYSLDSFSERVFRPLVLLTHLIVDHNIDMDSGCQMFPDSVLSHLPKLQHLQFDLCSSKGNGSAFTKGYLTLPNLKQIHTGKCFIGVINNNTFMYVPYIESLNIPFCLIGKYRGCPQCNLKKLEFLRLRIIPLILLHYFFKGLSTVKTLILTHAGMSDWSNDYFDYLIEIQELRLNRNLISYILKTNCILPHKLRILDFSENKIVNFQCEMPNLLYLYFQYNDLGRYLKTTNYMTSNTTSIKEVNFAFNYIEQLKYSTFKGHYFVEIINLSSNALSYVTFDLSDAISLKMLDLSNNSIKTMNKRTMEAIDSLKSDIKIDLSNNTLQCSCESLSFLQWMLKHTHRFVKRNEYRCVSTDKTIVLDKLRQTVQQLEKHCASYTVLISAVVFAILAVITISVTGTVYRFRWRLRYIYYMTRAKYKRYQTLENETEYTYNAFISYADNEKYFVEEECIPNLEQNRGLKLCFHHRDFLPGEDIIQNITNSIHKSRKTIFIISTSFLESDFCMWEFNMAKMESIYSRGGDNILFLVFYERIEPRVLPLLMLEVIQKQSYIEYPNDEQGNLVFWDKICETIE